MNINGRIGVPYHADDSAHSAGAIPCDRKCGKHHSHLSSDCTGKTAGQPATRGSNEDDNFEGAKRTVCLA